MKQQYIAMPGSKLSNTQARTVGREFDRIIKRNGCLKPDAVVQEAAPESSPIHGHFTWDDTEAARKCRVDEARQLIRSVRVVVADCPPQEQPVIRAYVNVQASDTETKFDDHAYISIHAASRDSDYKQQVLDAAKKELKQWQNKYSDMRDYFSNVFVEIESMEKTGKL